MRGYGDLEIADFFMMTMAVGWILNKGILNIKRYDKLIRSKKHLFKFTVFFWSFQKNYVIREFAHVLNLDAIRQKIKQKLQKKKIGERELEERNLIGGNNNAMRTTYSLTKIILYSMFSVVLNVDKSTSFLPNLTPHSRVL